MLEYRSQRCHYYFKRTEKCYNAINEAVCGGSLLAYKFTAAAQNDQPSFFPATHNTFADIESFKRLFLAEEVSAAKRCYGEARNNFGNLRAQLKVAVAEERAARVAERIAIEPRNQYNAAMLRSKRARDTFDLFVASRGTGSEDPTAATTTEGGGIVTTSADAGGADASGAAPSAAAGSIAVAGRGRPRGGAGRGERMSVKEEFPLKNPSAFGTKKL